MISSGSAFAECLNRIYLQSPISLKRLLLSPLVYIYLYAKSISNIFIKTIKVQKVVPIHHPPSTKLNKSVRAWKWDLNKILEDHMDPQSLIVSHLLPWGKLFLSQYGKSEANPMGSTWQSFRFIYIDEPYLGFQKHVVYRPFFISRKPLSREGKGDARTHSRWGPLCGLPNLYAFGEQKLGFQYY